MSEKYTHFNIRIPENAPGQFYVDQSCTDCEACRVTAPAVFKRNNDTGYSYVFKQPSTPEELDATIEALEGCPHESIHMDGDSHDWKKEPIIGWDDYHKLSNKDNSERRSEASLALESFHHRLPSNTPGRFYVDDQCLDCDACRVTAPHTFKRNDEEGYCYVYRQPETQEEAEDVFYAVWGCPHEAIHSDGHLYNWAEEPLKVYDPPRFATESLYEPLPCPAKPDAESYGNPIFKEAVFFQRGSPQNGPAQTKICHCKNEPESEIKPRGLFNRFTDWLKQVMKS